jgi:hypothetical protein
MKNLSDSGSEMYIALMTRKVGLWQNLVRNVQGRRHACMAPLRMSAAEALAFLFTRHDACGSELIDP